MEPVLIGGAWRAAAGVGAFHAFDPAADRALPDEFPVSAWPDLDAALAAAAAAAPALAATEPEAIARCLEDYARRIEEDRGALVALAAQETGLPAEPRLNSVELPRAANQLRAAATAVRERSWLLPTIDTKAGIRSCHGPLGAPIAVFGPNNFPLAFNAVAGSDFASALGARNPVIAKAHPSHPGTSRRLARHAHDAVLAAGLPPASVQLFYQCSHEDGLRLVSDPRLGALAFTGSRAGGLALKAAADAAGKPSYLELSSINPVFVMPGALAERGLEIAGELHASCTLGAGQFCTSPGVVVLPAGTDADAFVAAAREKFAAHAPGLLLNAGVREHLEQSLAALERAGDERLVGGTAVAPGIRFEATLLRADAERFVAEPGLQREAFGPATLLVLARDAEAMRHVATALEGNLTATIYSARDGRDDAAYAALAAILRGKAGRLLNDKMPTGVAVSAAMVHGGPYPATGHPGFTAVGMPAAIRRFAALHGYDAVRDARLPPELQDANPLRIVRCVDGAWTV